MTQPEQTAQLERYQRLIEIARDLASTLNLDDLLNRIVKAAADLCHAQAASILLYDEAKGQLYFEATTNLDTPLMQGLVVPVDASIAGWIVTERQPVIISETQKDPRHFGSVAQTTGVKTTSLLGVPLITKDKVVGVLEAINKLRGEFNEDDQTLLMALGAQAAVAIENARLFHQSDLISDLVHELRTPLASLNTATHLLTRPDLDPAQREKIGKAMNRETMRLSEMASSFLDLARLESGRVHFQLEDTNLKNLLEECASVMRNKAEEKELRLRLEISEDIPPFKSDPDKLKQVVFNLLSNAIKYTPSGGSITLSAEADPDQAIFSVQDTGAGIPPESLPHIFEKFYRVPGTEHTAQGTGLGLSICKKIVEAHQGRIELESQAGEGTIFKVYLPLKPGDN